MSNEFVEKDGKIGYIITIIILVLAVLGLSGYIVYDIYIKEDVDNCKDSIVEEKNKVYELTYSKAEEYIDKISVYNNYFYKHFLSKDKKEITNEQLLTFAFQMLEKNDGVTVENVKEILEKYFGKDVEFKHENIKCFAGEVLYEYDSENNIYIKKEHGGHGGAGSLGSEIFYVSSEVNGNKVKFVTKNVYERYCGDICGPIDAYYGDVDDVFTRNNPVLTAPSYSDEARIYRWNKEEILAKVPEVTYNFIIEDNGNFYLESVSIDK